MRTLILSTCLLFSTLVFAARESRKLSQETLGADSVGSLTGGAQGSAASCSGGEKTKVTHYGSDPTKYASAKESKLEGGSRTRYGKELNSVEQSIKNGNPVSLAGDTEGAFGQRCNRKDSACMMLVCYPKFDATYPEYRAKFPGVQKNCLIGLIEDTGGAFKGKGGSKIDVATQSIEKARKISGDGSWTEIKTLGCDGSVDAKRKCVVSNVKAECGGASGGDEAVASSSSSGGNRQASSKRAVR
jgi:hypothetical protein